jgi:hypothetical protein
MMERTARIDRIVIGAADVLVLWTILVRERPMQAIERVSNFEAAADEVGRREMLSVDIGCFSWMGL